MQCFFSFLHMLCCWFCIDVSDVADYKLKPRHNRGTRQDEEARKEKRNKKWAKIFRPDVCIWGSTFLQRNTSWKILLGGRTYLEGEYYNLNQPINCYVANFLPRLYFRSFLYNVRINLVDPIWGYPHQWFHKTQLVTRVEWTSKIYCVDCKLSFRIHYLSLKASTSSLLFGSLITTVSTV